MQVQIDTPYLSVEEYAKRSGRTVRAVREMCAAGDLPTKPRKQPGERYMINNALLLKQALESKY
ncbi:hypothetical protein [Thalassolituus sp.]|uniref:hypothetical protein n=1 Tax=Thalassolituus sp. TaxID=2030822 RepID=UPI00260D1E42|nr:hypothetical protein [Thalassolituus sp.]